MNLLKFLELKKIIKKICLVLAIVSVGLLSFASCKYVPSFLAKSLPWEVIPYIPPVSETFDQDFIESFALEYEPADSKLCYVSASPWEAMIEWEHSPRTYMFFAQISGVDKDMFVSGTSLKRSTVLDPYETRLYRHVDAPDPIEEWTIKSLSLYTVRDEYSGDDHPARDRGSKRYDDALTFAQMPLQIFLERGKLIGTVEAKENIGYSDIKFDKDTKADGIQRFIIIHFRENENIIACIKVDSAADWDAIVNSCTAD